MTESTERPNDRLPEHVIIGDAQTHETPDVKVGDLYRIVSMNDNLIEEISVMEFGFHAVDCGCKWCPTAVPQQPASGDVGLRKFLNEWGDSLHYSSTHQHTDVLDTTSTIRLKKGDELTDVDLVRIDIAAGLHRAAREHQQPAAVPGLEALIQRKNDALRHVAIFMKTHRPGRNYPYITEYENVIAAIEKAEAALAKAEENDD